MMEQNDIDEKCSQFLNELFAQTEDHPQVQISMYDIGATMGLEFDLLTELLADLKTIDVQLTSSRPKTAIVRECFLSIKRLLKKAGAESRLIRSIQRLTDR